MIEGSPRSLTLALALASALVATPAMAETATSTFQVTMTVQKACTVTAGAGSNISLGTVAATATDIDGNNTITDNCTKTTPYNIGLAPSNASTDGAGEMAGTGSNADKVAYQLRSTPGSTGDVWGDTATASSVGNGVPGIGTGADETHTVYVTVPSANFAPDTYTDTVTVRVHY